uniref:Uncharacterized protein n=1 Tax=Palpitomonas bilix TaxID=652834 RepID=A0A7S3GGL4_9EUKA|mmetsp:Transcript_48516/g.125890  ORF Transcript_48516/g.125890 Transcript_48516/m.125890 type:complete len:570 (+) Transcript_48516:74-1783(+)
MVIGGVVSDTVEEARGVRRRRYLLHNYWSSLFTAPPSSSGDVEGEGKDRVASINWSRLHAGVDKSALLSLLDDRFSYVREAAIIASIASYCAGMIEEGRVDKQLRRKMTTLFSSLVQSYPLWHSRVLPMLREEGGVHVSEEGGRDKKRRRKSSVGQHSSVSVKDANRGEQIEVDELFRILGSKVNDADAKVRRVAVLSLSLLQHASEDLLVGALERQTLGFNSATGMSSAKMFKESDQASIQLRALLRGSEGSITTALDDESASVRLAGVVTIGNLCGPSIPFILKAVDVLFDVLTDDSDMVRAMAINTLQYIAQEARQVEERDGRKTLRDSCSDKRLFTGTAKTKVIGANRDSAMPQLRQVHAFSTASLSSSSFSPLVKGGGGEVNRMGGRGGGDIRGGGGSVGEVGRMSSSEGMAEKEREGGERGEESNTAVGNLLYYIRDTLSEESLSITLTMLNESNSAARRAALSLICVLPMKSLHFVFRTLRGLAIAVEKHPDMQEDVTKAAFELGVNHPAEATMLVGDILQAQQKYGRASTSAFLEGAASASPQALMSASDGDGLDLALLCA